LDHSALFYFGKEIKIAQTGQAHCKFTVSRLRKFKHWLLNKQR